MDDDGSVFPKQKVKEQYNAKYQNTYSNRYYVLKKDFRKYTIIRRTYLGRKRRATNYFYLNSSPYSDYKRLLHIRSFLNNEIINNALRIGGGVENL